MNMLERVAAISYPNRIDSTLNDDSTLDDSASAHCVLTSGSSFGNIFPVSFPVLLAIEPSIENLIANPVLAKPALVMLAAEVHVSLATNLTADAPLWSWLLPWQWICHLIVLVKGVFIHDGVKGGNS